MHSVSSWLKFVLGSIFILALGIGTWAIFQREDVVLLKPSPEDGEKVCPKCTLVIKGIYAQEVKEGDKRGHSLKADELRISPRGLGIFLVQPVKEAILVNAYIEVHLLAKENLQNGIDIFPYSLISSVTSSNEKKDKRFTASSIGLITRLVFKKLHLNIYKGETLSVTVSANEALTNFKNKETIFKEFQIEQKSSKKLISTRSAKWDAKEKVFKIPGEYVVVTPKGTARAKGIKINLDFKVDKI